MANISFPSQNGLVMPVGWLPVQAIQLKELKKIAALGAGAFGQVFLVKHGSKYYALKCLSKALVMETGLQVLLLTS